MDQNDAATGSLKRRAGAKRGGRKKKSTLLPILSGVHEIRRKNLNLLADQHDGPTALARKLEHPGTSYMSQLTTGRKTISERTARTIEKQLRLPHMWFDGPAPRGVSGPVAVDMAALGRAIETVVAELYRVGKKIPAAKFADAVLLVYVEESKGSKADVAAVIRLAS